MGAKERGGHPPLTCLPASFPYNRESNAQQRGRYLIAWSVIAEVQAPEGSLVMIFWSSSALAVRS